MLTVCFLSFLPGFKMSKKLIISVFSLLYKAVPNTGANPGASVSFWLLEYLISPICKLLKGLASSTGISRLSSMKSLKFIMPAEPPDKIIKSTLVSFACEM